MSESGKQPNINDLEAARRRLAGYLVDSRLLRPAMVVVAKRPEPVVH